MIVLELIFFDGAGERIMTLQMNHILKHHKLVFNYIRNIFFLCYRIVDSKDKSAFSFLIVFFIIFHVKSIKTAFKIILFDQYLTLSFMSGALLQIFGKAIRPSPLLRSILNLLWVFLHPDDYRQIFMHIITLQHCSQVSRIFF